MTGDPAQSRRWTRRRGLVLLVGLPWAAALGCLREPSSCEEGVGLSAEEARSRVALEYHDAARDPARTCARCQHYLAAGDSAACGRCRVVPGPIHPRGWCRAFSPRPEVG